MATQIKGQGCRIFHECLKILSSLHLLSLSFSWNPSLSLYVYSSRAESKCSQRQQKALSSTVHRLSENLKQLQQENTVLREELNTDNPAGGIKGLFSHTKKHTDTLVLVLPETDLMYSFSQFIVSLSAAPPLNETPLIKFTPALLVHSCCA